MERQECIGLLGSHISVMEGRSYAYDREGVVVITARGGATNAARVSDDTSAWAAQDAEAADAMRRAMKLLASWIKERPPEAGR